MRLSNFHRYRLGYTVTRMHVDTFYGQAHAYLAGRVLDVGGTKRLKAGRFSLGGVPGPQQVEYLNIDPATDPDYLCSAEAIPIGDGQMDTIILSQVLEHLEEPEKVLREIHRVLRVGGHLVMTSPFIFRVHGEPHDYQRWTRYKLERELREVGFEILVLRELGGVFSVLVDIVKQACCEIPSLFLRRAVILPVALCQAVLVDGIERWLNGATWAFRWTTNYGVIARKG